MKCPRSTLLYVLSRLDLCRAAYRGAAWLGVLLLAGAPGIGWATISVDDCVRLAVVRAPAARGATFDTAAAAARLRAARAAYAPRLLAHGEYGRSEGFDEAVTNGGSTAALLTVETTLVDGGRRAADLAAARARWRSATALERQRRADVTLTVRTAYFNALAARAEHEIQREHVQTLSTYVDVLIRQETLGLVPHNDILRAQLALESARTARRAATADLAAARAELEVLTDVAVDATSLVEPETVAWVPVTDEAIDASAVLTDARAAAEAARREADAARSEWRGQVMLSASGGALGVQPRPTFRDHAGGEFLIGVTVPLYDGGATPARIVAAVAAAHSAEAALEQSRQTLRIALARARVDARRAEVDLAAARRVVPRAIEDFQLMRARYLGGGNVRLLEVLDAVTQSIESRLAVPRALLAYRLAVASADQLLGASPS